LKFTFTDDLFTKANIGKAARQASRIEYALWPTEDTWSKRFRKIMEDAIQKESGLPVDGTKGIIHITDIQMTDSVCASGLNCIVSEQELLSVTWQYEGYSSAAAGPNPGSIIHDFSAYLDRNTNHDAMQEKVMALFKTWTPTAAECAPMNGGAKVTSAQCQSALKFAALPADSAWEVIGGDDYEADDCGGNGGAFVYNTGTKKTLGGNNDCSSAPFSTDENTVQTYRVTYKVHMQNSEYENVEETIKAIQTTTNWGSPEFGINAMADLRADGTVKAMGIVLTSITSDPYSVLHLQHHD